MTRLTLRTAFLVLILLSPALPARGAESRESPLDRIVRLDLWGVGLNDAAREIQRQTGVPVLFFRADLPENENADTVYLVTGQVRLRTALECLARRFGFRYRLSADGKLEWSRSYGWVEETPAIKFHALDDLVPSGGSDPAETLAFLGELVKVHYLLPGETRLVLEKSPTPGNLDSLRCISALPPVAADYLEKGINCLAGNHGDFPVPGRSREQLYAVAEDPARDWEGLLAREVDIAAGSDLRAMLAGMAEQAGVAIILNPGGFSPAGRLDPGRVSLGKAAEELATGFGLGRRVFLAGGGISFESGPGEPWETDARSRELFWGGLAVAGFDARSAADRAGSGQALAALMRKEVFPALWRDPACALVYSQVTGRLVVIAPWNVVEAVAKQLGAPGGGQAGGR